MADRGWMTELDLPQPPRHTYLGSISGEFALFPVPLWTCLIDGRTMWTQLPG